MKIILSGHLPFENGIGEFFLYIIFLHALISLFFSGTAWGFCKVAGFRKRKFIRVFLFTFFIGLVAAIFPFIDIIMMGGNENMDIVIYFSGIIIGMLVGVFYKQKGKTEIAEH